MDKERNSSASESKFRGLVMTSVQREGHAFSAIGGLDAQELRHAVFLWDKMAWPSSNISNVRGGPDEEFLEAENIILRKKVKVPVSGDISSERLSSLIGLGHLIAFRDLNKSTPDCWALGQGLDLLMREHGFTSSDRGFSATLTGAIPVPRRDVPFAEVLEFKMRRHSEILELRAEIDRLKKTIEAASDANAELAAGVSQIDKACSQLIKVGHEWQFPMILSNMKCSFECRPVSTAAAGIGASTAMQSHQFPASTTLLYSIASALVATGTGLKFSFDPSWRGMRAQSSPYRYVYSFHREFF